VRPENTDDNGSSRIGTPPEIGPDRDREVLDHATERREQTVAARPVVTNGPVQQLNAPDGRIVVVGGDQTGTMYLGNVTVAEDTTYDVSGLPCPYLGLESFTHTTRDRYAGREQELREALLLLTSPGEEQVVLFVTGASGSGKSSFAQAGLVPALEAHYAAQRRTTRWAIARPGRRPLAALARALVELGLPEPAEGDDPVALIRTPPVFGDFVAAHTPPDQVNLLVLDQFEEFFTQADPDEREAALALVARLAPFRRLRTHVIVTLRADYLPAFSRSATCSAWPWPSGSICVR
jgi:hypothetical protein